MDVEYDDTKDAANVAKHGVSLQVGRIVLQNRIADVASSRSDADEDRRIAFGLINGRLFACVYTLRGETHRIISVRKASKQEQRRWQSAR